MKKTFVLILAFALAAPAFAANKDMVQLQTQVQQLQDSMTQMKQSFDERMGVMKNLIEQTTDNAGDHQDKKGSESQRAQVPGRAEAEHAPPHLGGEKMKEDVLLDSERPVQRAEMVPDQ